MRHRAALHRCFATLLLTCGLALVAGAARSAEPRVLAVAAADSYADVKKQLAWLGGKIGQPALPVVAESMLMMATQGRGLSGLDASRPLGLIVTTDGGLPIVHGYIPVKKLDQLLDSLQASIGVAERDGDTRRVTLPSGATIEFVEKPSASGVWAVAGLPGSPAGVADPLPHLTAISDGLSLGVRAFPSLMPEGVRTQLEALLDTAAKRAAAQGQPIAAGTVQDFLGSLADTESFSLGMAIDSAQDQVFVETASTNVAGSLAAKQMAAVDAAALTVGSPAVANGTRPAMRGHVAHVIPADVQPRMLASLDAAIESAADDPLAKSLGGLARAIAKAMLGSGSLEAAVTVDAPADAATPEITAGFRVKDGRALERQVKQMVGEASLPAGVRVSLDAGTAGAATLHRVSVDLEGTPAEEQLGKSLDLTLAVAPEYAFLLSGGDIARRAAGVVEASGRPDAQAKPIARMEAAVDRMFDIAARADGDDAEAAGRAAKAARAAGGGLVALAVRPIERGVSTRLSIDGAALQAGAALAAPAEPAAPGLPGGVPLPQGFPIPLPVR